MAINGLPAGQYQAGLYPGQGLLSSPQTTIPQQLDQQAVFGVLKQMSASASKIDIRDVDARLAMIASRLRVHRISELFQNFATFHDGDKVFVVLAKGGEVVVLTDTTELFPSDALVTQLRMLA